MTDAAGWITQYATTSQRLVNETGKLMQQVDHQIRNGTYGSEQVAKTANQLLNLAITTSLEWSQAVFSFWSPPTTDAVELSEFIEVEPDSDCERVLSVAKPFRRLGAESDVIGAQSLVFVPGILRVHAARFRVGIKGQNYYSGTYRGSVRLTSVRDGVSRRHEMDVTVDL
ncbi:hypothetical protein A5649_06145 [Mycolicibacter heraklionensis]|uniref:Uncharacterized protein n=1 Tax=Mycolicibacter heraklionensis TaxID=512402 RepID=A0AA91IX80_9MYCO|nr:hypothetical protein [Mycolicibacter heraklionensis]OBK83562.1 hypothetical protein A5649_06145 [Mycolicibacter heraklionensis]